MLWKKEEKGGNKIVCGVQLVQLEESAVFGGTPPPLPPLGGGDDGGDS